VSGDPQVAPTISSAAEEETPRVRTCFSWLSRAFVSFAIQMPQTRGFSPARHADLTPSFPLSASGEGEAEGRG